MGNPLLWPSGIYAILHNSLRVKLTLAALRRLYQAASLPNKPKNLIGLPKDLPPEQMRGLLLGSYTVDEETLRQLALARATAVRDALQARGAPNARLFLAAPKICDQACDETWRPHVELTLGTH